MEIKKYHYKAIECKFLLHQEIWMSFMFDMSKAIAIKPWGNEEETTVIFEHDFLVTNLTWEQASKYFIDSREL